MWFSYSQLLLVLHFFCLFVVPLCFVFTWKPLALTSVSFDLSSQYLKVGMLVLQIGLSLLHINASNTNPMYL